MHVIRKDAAISNTGDADEFPGTFEVVLSAPTLDRDGDTLLPEDWEQPLPEHITFDQDHAMTVAGTVGSGTPHIDEDGRLIVNGTYSSLQRAQDVRTLVNEGHIKTTSVAFMSKKVAKAGGDGYKIVRELLNGAFVAIPSNREALVLNSKGAKTGARNNQKDAAAIQSVHDSAVSLGASCDAAADDEKALRLGLAGKALAGSLEATQERMRMALAEAYPGQWAWIRGTVPDGDGGGYIVFELEDPETFETQTFQQAFTDDGSAVTLAGDPATVSIQEVISQQADAGSAAAADAAGTEPAAATAAAGEGKAAADAESPEDEENALMAIRARAFNRLSQL
jgi:hypothetical protein